MKFVYALVILSCALWETMGYPYYPAYGNVDSVSYGSIDNTRGGVAMSRYYNPYYNPRAVGGGMAAFMFRQPEEQTPQQSSQYYLPDRRRQTNIDYVPPQQNEVFYPQQPDAQYNPVQPEAPVAFPTEATELAEPTEKTEVIATTPKTIVPELAEPEVPETEEVEEPKLKKTAVSKKKQVKRPIDDDDEEEYSPKMPTGAFFPMFFGWGGRSSGSHGGPGGPTAIANAYSTGRGGVATSHATAYGAPRPHSEYTDGLYKKN